MPSSPTLIEIVLRLRNELGKQIPGARKQLNDLERALSSQEPAVNAVATAEKKAAAAAKAAGKAAEEAGRHVKASTDNYKDAATTTAAAAKKKAAAEKKAAEEAAAAAKKKAAAEKKAAEEAAAAAKAAGQAAGQAAKAAGGHVKELTNKLEGAVGGLKSLAAAGVALLTAGFLKGLVNTAGKAEQLGIVLQKVGNNAGISSEDLDRMDESVQKMGITASSSRASLIKLIQAGLVSAETGYKAAELARSAQDLAVVTGENSSDTFQRLIVNIQQMDTMGLRFMGLTVNMEAAWRSFAATINKQVSDLTQAEKQQAVFNAVLQETAKLAGSYEAALGSATKQAASLERFQETLSASVGSFLLPAYLALIEGTTELIKTLTGVSEEMGESGDTARALGDVVRNLMLVINEATTFLVKHRALVIALIAIWASFKVPTIFGSITKGFGLIEKAVVSSVFQIGNLGAVMGIASSKSVTALGKVKAAGALLGNALKGLSAVASALFVGWEIGTFLNGFKKVRDGAQVVISYLILGFSEFFNFISASLKTVFLPFSLIVGYVKGGIDGAKKAWDEYIKSIDKGVSDVERKARLAKDAWDSFGDVDLAEITNRAEEFGAKLHDQAKKVRDLKKALEEAREAVRAGASDESVVTTLEKDLKKAQDEFKITNKEVDKFKASLNKEQRLRVKGQIDIGVERGELNKELLDFQQELEGAKKAVGLDRISLINEKTISQDFNKVSHGLDILIKNFQRPFAQTFEGETRKIGTSFREIESSVLALAKQAKTPAELAISLGVLDRALEALAVRGRAIPESFKQLRQTLSFKQEQAELKALDQAIAGTTARMEQLKKAVTAIAQVQQDQSRASAEFKRTLVSMGVSATTAVGALGKLAAGVVSFGSTIASLAKVDITQQLQAYDVLAQAYKDDVSNLDASFKAKQKLIDEQQGTEVDRVRNTKTLASGLNKQRLVLAQEYYQKLQELQGDALSKYKQYTDNIRALDNELRGAQQSQADDEKEVSQSFLTEEQKRLAGYKDLLAQRKEARQAFLHGDLDEAKRLAQGEIELAKKVATDESQSIFKRKQAQKILSESHKTVQDAIKAEKREAIGAAAQQATVYDNLSRILGTLSSKIKELAKSQVIKLEAALNTDKFYKELDVLADEAAGLRLESTIEVAVSETSLQEAAQQIKNKLSDVKVDIQAVIKTQQVRAFGGPIFGPGTSTSDSIIARVSNGEYVVRAAAVQAYGRRFMDALNSMAIPKALPAFAGGGGVEISQSSGAGFAGVQNLGSITLNVGGKGYTLYGERQQAKDFVNIMKNLKRG